PLLRQGLLLAAQPRTLRPARIQRRKQAEIDVHRLEGPLAGLVLADQVAAGDMGEQGAEGSGLRRGRQALAEPGSRREPAGDKTHRRALDIAFAAGDLPGKAQAGTALELQGRDRKSTR